MEDKSTDRCKVQDGCEAQELFIKCMEASWLANPETLILPDASGKWGGTAHMQSPASLA